MKDVEHEHVWSEIFSPSEKLPSKLMALDSSLRCPICSSIFRIPVMLKPCQHTFCSECVRKSIQHAIKYGKRRRGECPTCRCEVDERADIFPNRCVEEIVSKWTDARLDLYNKLVEGESKKNKTSCNVKKGQSKRRRSQSQAKNSQSNEKKRIKKDISASAIREPDEGKRITRSAAKNETATDELGKEVTTDQSGSSYNCDSDDESDSDNTRSYDVDECNADKKDTTQAAKNSEVFSSSIASKPNCITRRSQTFYTKIKRKQLVLLCEKEGLNSKGSDKILESRHRAFVTLVNSECDALLPKSCKEIVKMVHDRERSEMESAKASLVDGTSRHSSYMKKIYERKDDSKDATITDSRSLSRGETAFDKELSNGFKQLIAETRRRQQLQKQKVVLTTEKKLSCDHLPAVVQKSVSASVSSDLGYAIDDGSRSSGDDFLESPSRAASSVKRVGHNTISNGLSSQSVNEEGHNLRQKQVPDDYPVSKVARSEPVTHVAKRSRFSTTKSNMISQVQPIHKKKSVTGEWQCSKCTYINKVRKWSSATCEMCDNPREDNSEVSAGVNANAATSSSKYFQIDC